MTATNASTFQQHSHPIQSRDFILALLKKSNNKLNRDQLGKALKLSGKEQKEGLRRRLRAMERDGQVIYEHRQGYSPINPEDLILGHVIGHKDGFGFLRSHNCDNNTGDDIFLHHTQMRQVFDGDQVQARITGTDNKGRKEAAIVKVLEHNTTQVVGKLKYENNRYTLQAENTRIANQIIVEPKHLNGSVEGQYVMTSIVEQPRHFKSASAKVTEILGDSLAPGMEINVAIRNYGIPFLWPKNSLNQAKKLGCHVAESDKQHRVDLRHLPFVTIDGEDAQDFDDAVYCEPTKQGGWRLFVAIADVSHYVKPGSPLDLEAQTRGTSVYFPGQVVPMLPESLSNGLCSLLPNTDRLVLICEMNINRTGKMTSYQFSEGLIHSHARLTYHQVNTLHGAPRSKAGKKLSHKHANVVAHIDSLYDLFAVLKKARKTRGSIDFDNQEVQFKFSADKKIEQIKPVSRNDAHKLIEECMLCANVATAQFLQKLKRPAMYRIHEGPQAKKLVKLREFLSAKGLKLAGGEKPTTTHYGTVLKKSALRKDTPVIHSMMLRSLSPAQYSTKNKGHFGLAYKVYAHFTSPIRRYPDLLVHRAIRAEIRQEQSSRGIRQAIKAAVGLGHSPVRRMSSAKALDPKTSYPYQDQQMQNLADHCSLVARRADKACWDVEAWLKCEYMQSRVGKVFSGKITSVTSFGLFVQLDNTLIEGLIHISSLSKDFYHFDETQQCLIGERSHKRYGLGEEIGICVANVDLDQRKIGFNLANRRTD